MTFDLVGKGEFVADGTFDTPCGEPGAMTASPGRGARAGAARHCCGWGDEAGISCR
ncbi:MAG: hypothetical protein Q4A13_09470 [Fretibacterium sp.]|nr:hypothetical protein [Fretibacterium sp.]